MSKEKRNYEFFLFSVARCFVSSKVARDFTLPASSKFLLPSLFFSCFFLLPKSTEVYN